MGSVGNTVRAANLLTREWLGELNADANGIISGVGAWLVLTSLLAASTGKAQAELEAAASIARSEAASSVRSQLERLDLLNGVSSAVGLWVRQDVPIDPDYTAAMERLTVDSLPVDSRDLDNWVSNRTSGLIDKFPGAIDDDTLMVLASALAIESDWVTPFSVGLGKWRGEGEWIGWLRQICHDRDSASLLTSDSLTIGRVICPTLAGFEVHLVSGSPTDAPNRVLDLAIDALGGTVAEVTGSELRAGQSGGCLAIEEMDGFEPEPRLVISLPAFEIEASHDLLARPELFGLTSAVNRTTGHFPGLSSHPLAVGSATQSASAGFSATGFRASVTTMATMVAGGRPPRTAHTVLANFDRPFGFLAVDPTSRLVLIAGWVAQPIQDFDRGPSIFI